MNAVFLTDVSPLENQEVFEYYYYSLATETRKQKADKLQVMSDKARCIGAEVLLRHAVDFCFGLEFDSLKMITEPNGKPYIEGNPFFFSLAHSGKYVVCAISDSPVGVDIEFDREFSPKFQQRFAKSVLEWTKMEAKGKLTGKGVLDKTDGQYIFTTQKPDGYIITVCSDKTIDNFLTYHLPFPC